MGVREPEISKCREPSQRFTTSYIKGLTMKRYPFLTFFAVFTLSAIALSHSGNVQAEDHFNREQNSWLAPEGTGGGGWSLPLQAGIAVGTPGDELWSNGLDIFNLMPGPSGLLADFVHACFHGAVEAEHHLGSKIGNEAESVIGIIVDW